MTCYIEPKFRGLLSFAARRYPVSRRGAELGFPDDEQDPAEQPVSLLYAGVRHPPGVCAVDYRGYFRDFPESEGLECKLMITSYSCVGLSIRHERVMLSVERRDYRRDISVLCLHGALSNSARGRSGLLHTRHLMAHRTAGPRGCHP